MASPPTKRGPGRPRDKYSERIQIRLSPAELARAQKLAAAEGHDLSSWIRSLVLKAGVKH
jgi:hypothetical protein